MEDTTDADYAHAKRVCKDFELKHLGEYHDLYVQSNALLLANISENFRNMCLKIQKLDLVKFLSTPGLAWQAGLENTKNVWEMFPVNGFQGIKDSFSI